MPFVSHPLASVGNLDNGTIYCNDKIFILEFLVFIIFFYLDVQPVYSSVYCSVIRNGRYFSFCMSLCNAFCLSIRKMKVMMRFFIKTINNFKNKICNICLNFSIQSFFVPKLTSFKDVSFSPSLSYPSSEGRSQFSKRGKEL